jgi:FAD/FMN-containing dehydrogenase
LGDTVRHIRPTRRDLVGGALTLAATATCAPAGLAEQRTVLNDASRLNPTPVAKHWPVRMGERDEFIARLRSELAEATVARRPVAAGAARHSMGGQSLPRDGTAITLSGRVLQTDGAAKTYLVEAGARWVDVIQTLDPLGFSPVVMQSNNDFGVGSTYCVNSHGWPVPYGPFGSTVRSLRMMLADGTIVECSRTKNSELFSLGMGGYGLLTVLARSQVVVDAMGANEIFSIPIQSRPGWRRVGLDVQVAHLTQMISAVERGGAAFEHAYDY